MELLDTMYKYKGSCHCGVVTFSLQIDYEIKSGTRCNCSLCKRLGIIHSNKIEPNEFKITSGKDNLHTYLFGDKVVEHQFCKTCGVYVFYTGVQCKVNLGCLEDLDTFSMPIENYDGKNLL